ncbi:MAG: PEP-utilizing enzyme [archaeon]
MKPTLMDKFLEIMRGHRFYPPVHNVTMLANGAGGFAPNFHELYYTLPLNMTFLITMKQDEGIVFMSETTYNNMAEDFFRQYWKNPNKLQERKKIFKEFSDKIDKIYNKLTYDFIQKNNYDTILNYLKEIIDSVRHLNCLAWFATQFDKSMCIKLIKELKIPITKQRLNQIWDQATTPISDSFDKKRQLAAMEITKKHKNWQIVSEKLQYQFADYKNVESPEIVQDLLKEKYEDSEIPEASEEKLNQFQEFLNKLNQDEKKLVHYIQEIINIRDSRKDPISKGITIQFRVAQKMFNEAGLEKDLIYYYNFEELIQGISYLKENKNYIKKRLKGYSIIAYYNGQIEEEYNTFDTIKQQIDRIYLSQEKQKSSDKLITGQSAYPGKVQGIVRIVRDPFKATDFKQGTILVTGMTRPEFAPLMRFAGAIITDEGGVTCHAAIVSRELKIPCIVGTKIASQILKTGDLVEIDADKGIVRIL